MNQYLLSVHSVEGEPMPTPEVMQRLYADVAALNEKIQKADAWVFGGGLHPKESATVVRAKPDGEVLLTDGPFAEAKEHIGGFWIIKAPDLDAALKWAAEASVACQGPVEVRPFQDEPA
ncbi:MAG: YciI family protein [Sandaracinaceae bacterium]